MKIKRSPRPADLEYASGSHQLQIISGTRPIKSLMHLTTMTRRRIDFQKFPAKPCVIRRSSESASSTASFANRTREQKAHALLALLPHPALKVAQHHRRTRLHVQRLARHGSLDDEIRLKCLPRLIYTAGRKAVEPSLGHLKNTITFQNSIATGYST